MKRIISTVIGLLTIIYQNQSNAQLTNGSTAPNFTLNDINGTSHSLYDYLDQGKTVYIDFFACHCPFCWNYHNTHALSDLYNEHGPSTSTNDIFVFAIELDANNGTNEFYGISGVNQGNWIDGTNYPQINPEGLERASIIADYAVNYYPLIYAICPDKTITVIGTKNKDILYEHTATCPVLGVEDKIEYQFVTMQQENSITVTSQQIQSNSKIQLIDIQGRKIIEVPLVDDQTIIPTTDLNKGVYFLRVLSDKEVFYSQKVQL